MMLVKVLLFSTAGLLRLWLMVYPIANAISSRVEVSTPLNSWVRVKEGIFLKEHGIPVYSGGVFHETPLCLLFFQYFTRSWQQFLPLLFVVCDLLTAYLLTIVAATYHKQMIECEKKEKSKYAKDALKLLIPESSASVTVLYVCVAYLFCPYTIASCVAMTTTVFANLILAATLTAMVKGYAGVFGILVALSTYQSFYPLCLLVPGILHFSQMPSLPHPCSLPLATFTVTLLSLLFSSAKVTNDWQFLEATYGFILAAPDLTPNIGLFWYFFTEMFEHFRLFFLATFQINAFIYVLPLATRLRKDAVLLAMALLALTAVFKSYPSLGDIGFYLSLLPMWKHLYSYFRQTFLVGCMLVVTSVLGPIMYNLWIFNGSANANFYFAVTLAFNTAQIFLLTDVLFAYVKRQYHLFNGSKMEVDGQPGKLTLE